MPLSIGTRFGSYVIEATLGAGGMGEVYRARDARLDREVAIKVLPASWAHDAERLRRFEQEARATSALNHPNILTIHELGIHEGSPYIVAELLQGDELRKQMDGRTLSPRTATDYAQQIASGLAAAHARGIVHRDLKPENVFITTDGRVKILDFGLAKLRTQPGEAGGGGEATRQALTDVGVVMGTVGYMAPEQVRGQEADYRADIFAFGVILYEMLWHRRAFMADSTIEVMNAILKEEPPEASGSHQRISPALERIVRRCLEKTPERRFQSASDLGFAIQALSTPSGSRLDPASLPDAQERGFRGWWPGQPGVAWILVGLLLAALGITWASRARPVTADPRVMKLSILPPERASFGQLAISPDGRWLIFTAATGGKVQLWVRALDTTEARVLPGTEEASGPFWSPDSQWIGFFAAGKLKKIAVSGELPATLCDVGVATGGTWNRDGVILFSNLGGGGLFRVPAAGGQPTLVKKTDRTRQESDFSDPWFLPDGRHYLYSKFSGKKETRGVYLAALDETADQRLLGDDSNAVYAPSIAGGGYLLFGRDQALMAQPFDAAGLQLTGEPFSLAGQVGGVWTNAVSSRRRNFSVSNNGTLVFDPIRNRERNQLMWVDRHGRTLGSIDAAGDANMHRLSPDDQRFVVSLLDQTATGSNDLWLSAAKGGNLTRFTFDQANDQFPVWSPDGSRIVWSSNRDGIYQMYEKPSSGAGQEALLLKSDHFKFPTDWSRDGRFILYRDVDPKTKYDIWALPVGERAGEQKPFPILATEANEAAAVLSRDGRWMSYSSDESGRYEVYVQTFPSVGGKRQVSTGGGIGPHWRGDGKELFYYAPDGKLMAVAITAGDSVEAGEPVALFEFRAAGNLITPYYSVTGDGQRFLLNAIVETHMAAPLTVVVNWTADVKR